MRTIIKKGISRYLVAFIFFIVLIIIIINLSNSEEIHKNQSHEKNVTVSTIVVKEQTKENNISYSVRVVGKEEVPVYANMSQGIIVEILAIEGQQVKRGQVLANLDKSLLLAQHVQLQANIRQAEQTIALHESLLEEAKAKLAQANSEKKRGEAVAGSGLISGEILEERINNAEIAKTHLNAANSNLEISKANLALIQGQMQEANVRLKQASVTAPVSGMIVESNTQVGLSLEQSTKPLFKILRNNQLEAEFEISNADLNIIKTGQNANIKLVGDSLIYKGKIKSISAKVNEQNQMVKVRVDFKNKPKLKIGQSGLITIDTPESKGIYLPITAISFDKSQQQVFVIKNNKAYQRTVEIGIQIDDYIEIKAGLKIGDQVVDKYASFLNEGQLVDVSTDQFSADTGN